MLRKDNFSSLSVALCSKISEYYVNKYGNKYMF